MKGRETDWRVRARRLNANGKTPTQIAAIVQKPFQDIAALLNDHVQLAAAAGGCPNCAVLREQNARLVNELAEAPARAVVEAATVLRTESAIVQAATAPAEKADVVSAELLRAAERERDMALADAAALRSQMLGARSNAATLALENAHLRARLAEAQRAAGLPVVRPNDIAPARMGDPAPGRSALERKT